MSKTPKFSNEQIDLIKSVLDSISPRNENPHPGIRHDKKGRRYSPSEKAAILADRKAKKTEKEILKKYGVCRETVNRWLRRSEMESGAPITKSRVIDQSSPTSQTTLIRGKDADNHKGYHPHWREVLKTWRARPGIGPAQVRNQLHRIGIKISGGDRSKNHGGKRLYAAQAHDQRGRDQSL